jgi:hypothetical protein
MNTMPAIGPYTSFDRGNTIQSTSVTIKIMSTSANLSGSAGKSANGIGAGITTAGVGTGMAGKSVTTGMTGMTTTTIDAERSVRHSGPALLIGWSLLLAPYMAAAEQPRESAIWTHARSFGAGREARYEGAGRRLQGGRASGRDRRKGSGTRDSYGRQTRSGGKPSRVPRRESQHSFELARTPHILAGFAAASPRSVP